MPAEADTLAMTATQALRATRCLLGLSIALQTIELLRVRSALGERGVFAWSVLRDDHRGAPALIRAALDFLLGTRGFVALLALQLAAALVLPWSTLSVWPLVLLTTTLLTCIRFRGTYNGGSDAMTIVVLLGVSLAQLEHESLQVRDASMAATWAERVGLGYIAAQLVLSYFMAGVAKLRTRAWREGRALSKLLSAPQYGAPATLVALASRRPIALAASWLVMAFECAFPLTLVLGVGPCASMLALGLSFHVFNAYALGLNRFVWAWLSAYPALLLWSQVE